MKYDVTKPTAPVMSTLGRGTECIKLLLSRVSKDITPPWFLCFFPILGAHMSGNVKLSPLFFFVQTFESSAEYVIFVGDLGT